MGLGGLEDSGDGTEYLGDWNDWEKLGKLGLCVVRPHVRIE